MNSGSCGDNLTWSLNSSGIFTVAGFGDMSDYSILRKAPWEKNSAGIYLVEIRPGVTGIGNFAFYSCVNLRNVIIPDSVTNIGENAFSCCSSLKSIIIPDSVSNIGDGAFSVCGNLTDIQVSNGNAFYIAENGVLYNKEKTKLVAWPGAQGRVIIPNGITSIGNAAFEQCNNLKHVEFPESLTFIGNSAFSNCDNLENINIPDGVTSIGDELFFSCMNLRSVTIGNSVTSIGGCAFFDCLNLISVEIGRSVINIEKNAFRACKAISSVTIPKSVSMLRDEAFSDCDSLTNIKFEGNAPAFGTDVFKGVNATAYYPAQNYIWSDAIKQNYGGSIRWTPYTPGTEITDLDNDQQLENGTCGDDLTWVLTTTGKLTISGFGAMPDYSDNKDVPWYNNRRRISDAVIEDGITAIGQNAFYDCSNLKNVSIPFSVTSIGDQAFQRCWSLKSADIPANVTSIGRHAFNECSSLKSVNIPASVTNIEDLAFNECDGLLDIQISPDNTCYCSEDGAIYNKDKTELVAWPVTHEQVRIHPNVKIIRPFAFAYSGVKTVLIPEGVTSIGDRAFMYCADLESVTIPASLSTIGFWAFNDCVNLKSVIFNGDAPTTIGDERLLKYFGSSIFGGVSATVNYPAGNPTWTDTARQNYGGTIRWVPFTPKTTASPYANAPVRGNMDLLASGTCGDHLTWSLDSGGKLTISGFGAMSDFPAADIVPWYTMRSGITSLEIHPGVTRIGNFAFYMCVGLLQVIIPDSVTTIGDNAFVCCMSLAQVVLPSGVTSIMNNAFSLCHNLRSIIIPDSLESIGLFAFSGCISLTGIQVSSGNTCYAAENGILYNKDKTKLIAWPAAKDDITVPTGAVYVWATAFAYCNRLKNVFIPDTVASIEIGAFHNCENLISVTIGSGVVRIGVGVFNQCRSLNSVTFRGNAPDFDGCAFEGVNAAVYYPAGNPTWTGKVLQNYGGAPRWIACVPKGEDASRAGARYPAGASLRNGRVDPSATKDPGKMLSQLLADFPDAVTDRKRLNALLQDYMPNEKMIRNTLLLAFDEGIVEDLRLNTRADELTIHRYERQLTDAYGLAGATAEQAVELWIKALGIEKI